MKTARNVVVVLCMAVSVIALVAGDATSAFWLALMALVVKP